MKKSLFVFLLSLQVIFAQTYEISHDIDKVVFSEDGPFQKVDYSGQLNLSALNTEIGAPDLPSYLYKIILPQGTTVGSWKVEEISESPINGSFQVKARQHPWTQESDNSEVEPDAAFYQSDQSYPEQIVQFSRISHFNGRAIAHFLVSPLRYEPLSQKLVFIDRIRLSLELQAAERDPLQPYQLDNQRSFADTDKLLQLVNTQSAEMQLNSLSENSAEVDSTRLSALNSGQIDEYVIISVEEFADALQPLIEWKKRRGVPTVLRTLSWIRENFPNGVDDAERMRNFIRWSYQKRGTRFVLLAGDTYIVPTRVITTGGYTFAADYYFSDLDGTWNADQDDIFGEAVDELDGYPEAYVGRIPADNTDDVERFVERLFKYEKLNNVTSDKYPENILYMAANLSKENDGRDLILKHIDPQINPSFERRLITQSEQIGSDPAVAIAELNKNYGLIFSESHGAYHTIRPGAHGSSMYSYNLDELTNQDPAVWYIASCYTNDILKRAFSEMYLLSKTGGGVAYIGNSSFEYPFSGVYLQKEFYKLVFEKGYPNMAEAHFLSRLPYLGYLSFEGPSRIIVYSTTVLGDPEMPIWTDSPADFTIGQQIIGSGGQRKLQVTVKELSNQAGLSGGLNDSTGQPSVPGAMVVLYRDNDIYEIGQSNEDGDVFFDASLLSADSISLTVSKHNFRPYETVALSGTSSNKELRLTSYTVDDTNGNNNQRCEPGETSGLYLKLVNRGSRTINQTITATIDCKNSFVHLIRSQIDTLVQVNPTDSLLVGPFQLKFDAALPSDTSIVLQSEFYEGFDMLGSADIELTVDLPFLKPAMQYASTDSTNSQAGTVYFTNVDLDIINSGRGGALDVTLELLSDQQDVQILTPPQELGALPAGQLGASPGTFRIEHRIPAKELNIRVQLSDRYNKTWQFQSEFKRPEPPHAFRFSPADGNSVELNWDSSPSDDVLGYYIYRQKEDESTFTRITDELVENGGYYLDQNITASARYTIQAVDSSANLSDIAPDTLFAWPSLPNQQAFPTRLNVQAIGSEISGLVVYDLNGDERNEIVACGGHGVLQIFGDDGSLFFETDQLKGNMTIPAIGNVCADDAPEIVVSTYTEGSDDNYIYIVHPDTPDSIESIHLGQKSPTSVVLKDLDYDGLDEIIVLIHAGNAKVGSRLSRLFIYTKSADNWAVFDGWPAEGFAFSSNYCLGNPAVADLDHSGEMRIIVGTQTGQLYSFRPTVSAEPEWIIDVPGILNTPISLADIDGDLNLDIIAGVLQEDKLYIFDHTGTPLSGWENGLDVQITDPYIRSSAPVVGNLDDDENLEVAYVGRRQAYIFNHDGSAKDGWPKEIDNGDSYFDSYRIKMSPYASPVLADINQDGSQEILYISTYGKIHALDVNSGLNIAGFPLDTHNDMVNGQSPVVDDLDRDGDLEVLYVGHEGILFAWDSPDKYPGETQLYWNQPFANAQHSGELDTLKVSVVSGIEQPRVQAALPENFYLKQNYPNPFNPQTTIEFGLVRSSRVKLTVYNLLGQEITTLFSGLKEAGEHRVAWNGKNRQGHSLGSGVYIYRLEVKEASGSNKLFVKNGKMILLK